MNEDEILKLVTAVIDEDVDRLIDHANLHMQGQPLYYVDDDENRFVNVEMVLGAIATAGMLMSQQLDAAASSENSRKVFDSSLYGLTLIRAVAQRAYGNRLSERLS